MADFCILVASVQDGRFVLIDQITAFCSLGEVLDQTQTTLILEDLIVTH
jgi:hypothetical protein